MVGEGVLMECLENERVSSVLCIGRNHSGKSHPKLEEFLVKDFFQLEHDDPNLMNFDACFYCAGISSVGMDEKEYNRITYDTTMHVAKILLELNPSMTFNFVSGANTDSSEKGKVMWSRVKGKTENALTALPFKGQYNFRPGLMKPAKGQTQLKGFNRYVAKLYPLLRLFFNGCSIQEIGKAMINSAIYGYHSNILEVSDIKSLAVK